jgi:transposase
LSRLVWRLCGIHAGKEEIKIILLEDYPNCWLNARSLSNNVNALRRGAIVYTDKFRSYDSLMFCGNRHLKIDHQKRFPCGKVYINGVEGLWSYAKERLIKHHGVSKEKFPLYLKDMEFRYNNRNRSIFQLLVDYLLTFVPDRL